MLHHSYDALILTDLHPVTACRLFEVAASFELIYNMAVRSYRLHRTKKTKLQRRHVAVYSYGCLPVEGSGVDVDGYINSKNTVCILLLSLFVFDQFGVLHASSGLTSMPIAVCLQGTVF